MTRARDIPPAIQWHEGMLLAPQHFQQAALRQEELLSFHATRISPYHWGISHLKIDPVQLAEGTFRVLELEAVMPDGLVVSYDASEGEELAVDVTAHAEEMRRAPLAVHLAVALQRSRLPLASGDGARYRSTDATPVADANTGEGELHVPRLEPRLRLWIGDVPRKYTSFPLARLRFGPEQTVVTTDYVPPMLRVPRSSPLGETCSRIAQKLREKASFLCDRVHSPALASRMPLLLETRQKVHNLVAALPPFEALLMSGEAHPHDLYLRLAAIVGHVAAIGDGLVPPVLDTYDHNDLRATFEPPRSFVFQTLDEGINEFYTGFPFYEEGGSFFISFDESWMERQLLLGVRGRQGTSPDTIRVWIEQSLVGSVKKIPRMRDKRIRGAAHQATQDDKDLMPGGGVSLFSLAADPDFIEPGELLQVLNLDDAHPLHRPLEIVLYVREEPKEP